MWHSDTGCQSLCNTQANAILSASYHFYLFHHYPITSSFSRFLDHTQRATVGRTPLDEWSMRHRYLYLTTHNTHNRQTSMPPVGFEPTIAAGERPKTYVLDRVATGTGTCTHYLKHLYVVYRVSHQLRSLLRESVPYVKIYRYNPKHLYPKLNGYGDNGQRKVWTSCISAYCTSSAVSRIDLDREMQ